MSKANVRLVLRVIALICVVLFVGYNIYLWNAQTLKGNVLPMPFGIGTAIVLSGSMEPALYVDDLIIIKEQKAYGIDDVVVYQSDRAMVVHRVIAIDGDMVTTKGDANNVSDAPIEKGNIKGKVVGCVPNVGWLVRLLKAPTVAFSLMALAIFLLERSFRKEKEQKKVQTKELEEEIRRLREML